MAILRSIGCATRAISVQFLRIRRTIFLCLSIHIVLFFEVLMCWGLPAVPAGSTCSKVVRVLDAEYTSGYRLLHVVQDAP